MKRPPEPRARKPWKDRPNIGPWLLLLGVAFAVRAAVVLLATRAGASPPPQAPGLDAIAWNLAHGSGFSLAGPSGPVPTALLPPLAPWTTSLAYRAGGHSLTAALLLQSLFGASACLLIAWFGAATIGGTIGRTAGWISAFDPLLVCASGALLVESSLGPLLLISLGATAAWIKTPRPGRALGVGIAWGLAILANEFVLFLPLLALIWAWVPLGLTVTGGERNRQAFLLLLGVVLAVAPWTIRNAVVLRAPAPVTTRTGRVLLEGNNAVAWLDPERRGEGVDLSRLPPYDRELTGLPEARADAIAAARAWSFIESHRGDWPMVVAAKVGRLWRPFSEPASLPNPPPAGPRLEARLAGVDAIALWSCAFFPLALWGITRILVGARRWYQSLGLVALVYVTGVAVVFHGALRMRVPIEPLLALYAAVGFESARRRMRTRSLGLRVVEGRR